MNEPALFIPMQSTMPEDVVHPGDGEPRLHGAGPQPLRLADGARRRARGSRGCGPTGARSSSRRAGFAGLQRHALQWTGDNSSWWEHLWMSMPQLQNLGLSGVAFCGVDVGGFFGDCDGELLARWTELGDRSSRSAATTRAWARCRRSRGRSASRGRASVREMLQAAHAPAARTSTARSRSAAHRRADPAAAAVRAPGDATTYTADDEFLLGDALLVAPITRPGIEHRHVYLPGGDVGALVDAASGSTARRTSLAHAPLGQPALYARANARDPAVAGDAEHGRRAAAGPADAADRLRARRGARTQRELYEDAGEGFGASARRSVRCDGSRIELGERRGDYVPPGREAIELELRGVEPGTSVRVDGEPAEAREEDGALVVALEDSGAARVIELG